MRHLICGGILFVIASMSGCGRSCQSCIASMFQGFNLVAEYPEKSDVPDIDPRHVLPFPSEFIRGRTYVFQSIAPITTEQVALETFPTRLRKCSMRILEAPRNPGDFLVSNLGGPRWNIRFTNNRCGGHLYNHYDRKLAAARIGWPSGSHDDYILQVSGPQN